MLYSWKNFIEKLSIFWNMYGMLIYLLDMSIGAAFVQQDETVMKY